MISPPVRKRIYKTVAEVLKLPVGDVSDAIKPENTESWDSLQHINLILALEKEFGIRFGQDEIQRMLSVQAIGDVVSKRVKE